MRLFEVPHMVAESYLVSLSDSDEFQTEYRSSGPPNHGKFYRQWWNLAEEMDEHIHVRAFEEHGGVTTHATAFHGEIEHDPLAAVYVAHEGTPQFNRKARMLPSI